MFSKHLFPRRALQFPLRSLQTHSHRDFSIGYGLQQTQGKTNSQVISEVAREEGGPSKGSASAQLQSQATKERNNQQTQGNTESQIISEVARQEGGTSKGSASAQMQSQVTKARNNQQTQGKTDSQVISEVARQEGGPSKGSASAQLQSQVAKQNNSQQGTAELGSTLEQNSSTSRATGGIAQQAQSDRKADYEDVASKVQDKIATDPASVTPEDGNLARSRETRAFGATEKGGVAATAQSLGSENAKAGRV